MPRGRFPIQIRLSNEDHAILKSIEDQTGLSRTEALRLALRALDAATPKEVRPQKED